MKNQSLLTLLGLTLSFAALSFTACGKKTETKTVVIEKQAPVRVEVKEPKPNVSVTVHGDGKNGHVEVHGEK